MADTCINALHPALRSLARDADADGNGHISREEMKSVAAKRLGDKAVELYGETLQLAIDSYEDTSPAGRQTFEQAKTTLDAMGLTLPVAARVSPSDPEAIHDHNRDGAVELREVWSAGLPGLKALKRLIDAGKGGAGHVRKPVPCPEEPE